MQSINFIKQAADQSVKCPHALLVSYRVRSRKYYMLTVAYQLRSSIAPFPPPNNMALSNLVCVLCVPVSVNVCLLAVVASPHHRHGHGRLK
jgi:hypothetical protein